MDNVYVYYISQQSHVVKICFRQMIKRFWIFADKIEWSKQYVVSSTFKPKLLQFLNVNKSVRISVASCVKYSTVAQNTQNHFRWTFWQYKFLLPIQKTIAKNQPKYLALNNYCTMSYKLLDQTNQFQIVTVCEDVIWMNIGLKFTLMYLSHSMFGVEINLMTALKVKTEY